MNVVETSVIELYRLCERTAGVGGEPHFAPERSGDLRHSSPYSSLAASELGWHAETALGEGIARTWNRNGGGRS